MMSSSSRGYTLLEMIVAVGVFSIVMLAATGAYLTLIKLDRQARATNDVVTNLSFAVDSMARAIRTGSDYRCNVTGTNCTSTPGTSFGFEDSENPTRSVVYEVINGQVIATVDGVSAPITDPRIRVQGLNFFVRGVGSDGIQPQVIFTIRGTASTTQGEVVDFTIETGATQRLLDI